MDAEKIPFVLVDSDEIILDKYENLIKKIFPGSPVHKEDTGKFALDTLKRLKQVAVIIWDFHQQDIGALQMIQNLRSDSNLKMHYFIMAHSNPNRDDNLKALQLGCDDILKKPFAVDELLAKLRLANRYCRSYIKDKKNENIINVLKNHISESANQVEDVLVELQSSRGKTIYKTIQEIKNAAIWVAEQFQQVTDKDLKEIERAANFFYIGKLPMNDRQFESPVMKKGQILNSIMEKVPIQSHEILNRIEAFKGVATLLKHLWENFDGSGFPDKLMSRQIPLGARIIRVAADYQQILVDKKGNHAKVMEELYAEYKRLYDYKVVAIYDQYLGQHEIGIRKGSEARTKLTELKPRMTLARNIVSQSGHILMTTGMMFDQDKIDKLQNVAANDPIIGDIYIRKA